MGPALYVTVPICEGLAAGHACSYLGCFLTGRFVNCLLRQTCIFQGSTINAGWTRLCVLVEGQKKLKLGLGLALSAGKCWLLHHPWHIALRQQNAAQGLRIYVTLFFLVRVWLHVLACTLTICIRGQGRATPLRQQTPCSRQTAGVISFFVTLAQAAAHACVSCCVYHFWGGRRLGFWFWQ